ncbi:putative endonuclease from prophage, replication protein A (GpA) [Escherichia coli]|uniref:Putative endonuclease from prophage, replication protein A (GpA) n=1 Tax=Escherichia coli TaxID=562 RepID=A0A377D4F2_ECOLX|nr:putative endonuclease from prophage, replication protein A (GpA) [Escherichia coli]
MTAHRTGHMLVIHRPDNEERIIEIMRDAAIKSDRAELGNDISPRFKCEKNRPGKRPHRQATSQPILARTWTPAPFTTMTRKPANPYADKESGKTMAETVENAIAWASLHRIRQFQFFGIPPARYGVNSAALPDKWSVTPHHRSAWT